MKLHLLKIIGLYGYFDKDIDFESRINILLGINGSGKTSVLNIINWMLKPSILELAVNDFKALSLEITVKNERYLLNVKKDSDIMQYRVVRQKDSFIFPPLIVSLLKKQVQYTRQIV